MLSEAWAWTEYDRILNVLPLHHLHGVVNVVNSALYNLATCEMHESFHPSEVWKTLFRHKENITVFMGVPTIYYNLIKYYHEYLMKKYSPLAIKLRL